MPPGRPLARPLLPSAWRRLPPPAAGRCGPLARRPLQQGREGAAAPARGTPTFAVGSRRLISGQPVVLPEHLQRIVDDYDRQRAAEDASQGWIERLLRSKAAGPIGAGIAGGFMYLMYSLDDVTSGIHDFFGWLLSRLEPATARGIILTLARGNFLPKDYDKDDPYLVIEPFEGFQLMAPVGLAPGIDREAVAPNSFLTLGFGFVEVGPVVPDGASAVRERLAARDASGQLEHLGIVGVSVRGSNKQELLRLVSLLGPHVDYLAVDLAAIPSGEREKEEELRRLVTAVVNEAISLPSAPKVFLRVPSKWPKADSTLSARVAAAASLASIAHSGGAAGLILRHKEGEDEAVAEEETLKVLSEAYRAGKGSIALVACGGVRTGRDALDRIEAGATAVQISDAIFSEGPQVCRRIKNELSQVLANEGYVNLQDAVGAVHRRQRKGRRKNPWKGQGSE